MTGGRCATGNVRPSFRAPCNMAISDANRGGAPGAAPGPDPAHILHELAGLMAISPGRDFLDELVNRAVQRLGVDYAWVVLHGAKGEHARTVLSANCRMRWNGAESYLATGQSALAGVLSHATQYVCARDLERHVPGDLALRRLGAQACVAHALRDESGLQRGHVAFVFSEPLADPAIYVSALSACATFTERAVLALDAERKARQEALQLASRYQALFEKAPVLINAFDARGKCILWNLECERKFGWSVEEVNNHPEPLALFYPDPQTRARVVASVSQAPGRAFEEWHPVTRAGKVLSTLWSNIVLESGTVVNIGLDITERKRAELALTRLATIDSLTDCWNRAEILKILRQEITRLRQHPDQPLAVVMLDLDHFKQLNDLHGHLVGDAALRYFSDQLRSNLRGTDFVGRIGGEEFLALLPGCDGDAALAMADRLRAALRNDPFTTEGQAAPLSVSVGIAFATPEDTAVSDVMRRADTALYEAKRRGRDRAVVYFG